LSDELHHHRHVHVTFSHYYKRSYPANGSKLSLLSGIVIIAAISFYNPIAIAPQNLHAIKILFLRDTIESLVFAPLR